MVVSQTSSAGWLPACAASLTTRPSARLWKPPCERISNLHPFAGNCISVSRATFRAGSPVSYSVANRVMLKMYNSVEY
jgi:hypothetical protein